MTYPDMIYHGKNKFISLRSKLLGSTAIDTALANGWALITPREAWGG